MTGGKEKYQMQAMDNVTGGVLAGAFKAATVPAAGMDKNVPRFQENVDYSVLIQQSVEARDFKAAGAYESARNAKIDAMGLPYEKTSSFGTSVDLNMMNNEELGAIYDARQAAATPEQMASAHAMAERFRARYGYTGGPDGSKPAAFDPEVDYASRMVDAIDQGDYKAAAGYETMRNAKIDATQASYAKTNDFGSLADRMLLDNDGLGAIYEARQQDIATAGPDGKVDWTKSHGVAESVRAGVGYSGGVDGGKMMPYDSERDYSAEITKAVEAGDYKLGALYETMRNAKIKGMELPYPETHDFGTWEDVVKMSNQDLGTCYNARIEARLSVAPGQEPDWTKAHATVESIRGKYGYTGGIDGSQSSIQQPNRYAEACKSLGFAAQTPAPAPSVGGNELDF